MIVNFDDLYEKFYPQVYNYVFYRVLNKEVTEDLVSDVFIKVIAKYDTYDVSKSRLSTWIFAITKNTVIDYYRWDRPVQLDEKVAEAMIHTKDDDPMKNKEQKDDIVNALKRMSELDRTVIVLKYFSDMTYEQMAKHVGYSPKHVGVILSRALRKLKKIYEEI